MEDKNPDILYDEALQGQENPAADDGRQAGRDAADPGRSPAARVRPGEEGAAESRSADTGSGMKHPGEQGREERARQAAARRMREREAARQNGFEAGWAAARAAAERDEKPLPAVKADIPAELAEIRAMDPEMTDLNAILRSEAGGKFREYVKRGLSFTEAYTLAARSRLADLAVGRGEKAAQARAAGKGHLTATGTRGAAAPAIPADELAFFRALNPGVSDAEIRKYYAADRKRFGG